MHTDTQITDFVLRAICSFSFYGSKVGSMLLCQLIRSERADIEHATLTIKVFGIYHSCFSLSYIPVRYILDANLHTLLLDCFSLQIVYQQPCVRSAKAPTLCHIKIAGLQAVVTIPHPSFFPPIYSVNQKCTTVKAVI